MAKTKGVVAGNDFKGCLHFPPQKVEEEEED